MKKPILFLLFFSSCTTPSTYFSEEENMWLYVNQTKENIHRPLQLDWTKEWIAKSDSIGLENFKINVIGKKHLSLEMNNKSFSFDENWIGKKEKTIETTKKLEAIAKYLSISNKEAEEVITGFLALGLNRYSNEKEYILFENETWLTFSKGYLYFPKEYKIEVNDTINLKDLTKVNSRVEGSKNYIIKNKIDKNWLEWYRPTGL